MKSYLHQMEKWIQMLPSRKLSGNKAPLSARDIDVLLDQALKAKDLVRLELMNNGLTQGEDKPLQVMVNCYHDSLIKLSNEVYSLRQEAVVETDAEGPAAEPAAESSAAAEAAAKPAAEPAAESSAAAKAAAAESTAEPANPYDALLAALGELLFLLKENFGPYVNRERKIPNVDRDRFQRFLKEQWEILRKNLSQRATEPVDRPYRLILERWVLVTADLRYTPYLNDRQHTYAQVLLNELRDRIAETPPGSTDEYSLFTPLTDVLVYMNFNHPGMARNIITQWRKNLLRLEPGQAALEDLRHKVILLHKMPVQKIYALYPDKPGLGDQLDQWLTSMTEGIDVPRPYPTNDHDTTKSTMVDEARSLYTTGVAIAAQGGKMELAISVPMLALFIKLLIDSGIIHASRQKEAIRFFAFHFYTVRRADISYSHMSYSFQKVNPILIPMLRQCLKRWDGRLSEWGKDKTDELKLND